MDDDDILDRLRALCLALPEVTERLSHGSPTFFIRGKKSIVSVDDHHHGAQHLGFWCPAPPGVQEEMIAEDATRFFRPPYVGPSGWLGVRLSGEVDGAPVPEPDWAEVEQIVREAYRKVAPKSLSAQLDSEQTGPS